MADTQFLFVSVFLFSVVGNIFSQNETEGLSECSFVIRPLTEISLFTLNGTDLPTKSQALVISSPSKVSCVLRTSKFLFPPVWRQLLIYSFVCQYPHSIIFDTENVTTHSDNIAYLQVYKCLIDGTEISKFEQLYNLKILTFFETVPTSQIWLGKNSTFSNVSSIDSVVAYTIHIEEKSNQYRHQLPWIFEVNRTFPNMGEMSLAGIGLTELPPDLSVRFPNLQSIALNSNNFTYVPVFPITEKPFLLPLNLSRTQNMQNHYADSIGINIRPNEFRRILEMNDNFIKFLPENFINGTLQLISINSNGLVNISDHAFDRVIGLQSLSLKNNSLVSINNKVFKQSKELLWLQLQQNHINWIHGKAFRYLSKLTKLDLSANNLTMFEPGTFYWLKSLRSLELGNNNINKFDQNVLKRSMVKLRSVNLSGNNLQNLPVMFFLIRGLEMVDLSHCQISIGKLNELLDLISDSDLIDSIIPSASSSTVDLSIKRENKRKMKLENNLIRRLDFSGLSEINKRKLILILNNYELILTGNPIDCDCHLVSFLDFFEKAHKNFDGTEYFYHKWLCHSPPEFKDRPLLSLKKNDLYCREEMPRCPINCTCYKRYVSKVVIVNCSHSNLIKFPDEMPDGQLELWLQNNNITELSSKSYLPRVEVLKMTKNLISNLNVSVLKQMKSIKKLFFDANLLTTLPKEIQEISFELLVIDNNHLVCDCHNQWMKAWLLTSQNSVHNWQKIACSNSKNTVLSIVKVSDDDFICIEEADFRKTLALGFSLGFVILILHVCLCLLFYYRLEVKVLIYIYFNLHPFDCDPQKIDDEKEPIDTLVICSKSMIEWVSANIIDTLESLRFNVLDINRDFLIGMSIRENMRVAVCRSKRSIVILSEDSFNDPLVQLALTFTYEKVLRQRPTYMVLFLHNIKKCVTNNQDLKKYLSNGRYVRTGDSLLKQKMLYMLTGSNESKNHSKELRRQKSYKKFFPEIMDTTPTDNVVYDIFISYPDRDYQFATGILFPDLHQRGYRVCLPDRDFLVGTSKEENILNAIDQSKRTLVIVTESHVDDEWQLFTLRTAMERSLKETSNYLLCMLDPKVDVGTLDPETRDFLSTHVIIFQNDPLFWQKFYRSIPPPAFKTVSHQTSNPNEPSNHVTSNSNTPKSVFSIA